jgi:hypothetical protein
MRPDDSPYLAFACHLLVQVRRCECLAYSSRVRRRRGAVTDTCRETPTRASRGYCTSPPTALPAQQWGPDRCSARSFPVPAGAGSRCVWPVQRGSTRLWVARPAPAYNAAQELTATLAVRQAAWHALLRREMPPSLLAPARPETPAPGSASPASTVQAPQTPAEPLLRLRCRRAYRAPTSQPWPPTLPLDLPMVYARGNALLGPIPLERHARCAPSGHTLPALVGSIVFLAPIYHAIRSFSKELRVWLATPALGCVQSATMLQLQFRRPSVYQRHHHVLSVLMRQRKHYTLVQGLLRGYAHGSACWGITKQGVHACHVLLGLIRQLLVRRAASNALCFLSTPPFRKVLQAWSATPVLGYVPRAITTPQLLLLLTT